MSHEVTVKVLRLGKPHFNQRDAFEEHGIYQDSLVLPRTIGPCFSGEQFHCLLAVVAKNAVSGRCHIELQDTISDPVVLYDGELEFDPEKPWTLPLQSELTAPGPRVLQVQIKYKHESIKTLTKSFSFDVSPAITARTRLVPIDKTSGLTDRFSHTFEIHVENVTESIITLSSSNTEINGAHVQMEQFAAIVLKPHDVYSIGCLVNCEGEQLDGTIRLGWAREPLGVRGSVTVSMKR